MALIYAKNEQDDLTPDQLKNSNNCSTDMKEELFQELLQSVREMKAIRSGKAKPSRSFTFDTPAELSRVRSQLGVSQPLFARLLGISKKTLQNWEQGRRKPTGPAKVLLKVAARHPKLLLETVK